MSFLNMFKHSVSPDQPQEKKKELEDLSAEELENMLQLSVEDRYKEYIKYLPTGYDTEMMLSLRDNNEYIQKDIQELLDKKKELVEAA